jgi:hypothetical protein
MNVKASKFTKSRIEDAIFMLSGIALCYFGLWYSQFLFIIFFLTSVSIAINNFVIESRKKKDKSFNVVYFLSYQNNTHLPMIVDIIFYSSILFMLGWAFTTSSLILFVIWWYSFYIDFMNRVKSNQWWKRLPDDLKETLLSDESIDN